MNCLRSVARKTINMESKQSFIGKHKKLPASFFIVALAIASVAAYMRTEGVTVGSVTVKVDAQSGN